MKRALSRTVVLAAAMAAPLGAPLSAYGWEPTKNVEFIIPAGTGGGADQMARAVQGIVAKHNLMKQSILPINKAGGAGAEGFLDVKGAKGDPHKIIITLSNLFTTPLATGVPFKGGGEVCVNLVGKHVDSTVNNPIECVSHWKAGRVRPLAVFDSTRIPVAEWKDIPTVKEALGIDVHYLMLRGIFGAPGMPKDAVEWYQAFFKKVIETPEWKKYMEDGALKAAFATGPEYVKWVEENEQLHKDLMAKGGLLKK